MGEGVNWAAEWVETTGDITLLQVALKGATAAAFPLRWPRHMSVSHSLYSTLLVFF